MPAQQNIDLFKLHKDQYAAAKKPFLVRLPPAQYLALEGMGEPGGERFTACIGALDAVAFTIKMTRKFAGKRDYAVCKLEALMVLRSRSSADSEDRVTMENAGPHAGFPHRG